MNRIVKPRDLISRRELLSEVEELMGWSGSTPDAQRQAMDMYRQRLEAGRAEIKRRFEEGEATGRESVRAGAYLLDQLIRVIYQVADDYVFPLGVSTKGDAMTLLATGGYGRGELAPHSDIDLMFLLSYKLTPRNEQVVEYVLYTLWDLGLKVGHATRSTAEAVRLAKEDITIRTSLLEARMLTGDQNQFAAFQKTFRSEVVEGTGTAFVEAKLSERDQRHGRMGDTRYVLEPNIKEGKGGLRDLQTLQWICNYLYGTESMNELHERGILTKEDARRFAKSQEFLWTVRCHLHYLADRPEERLTFNVQTEIGERMNYTDHRGLRGVERFMKHYFLIAKDVGDLTRIICATLEEQHKKKRQRLRLPRLGRKQSIAGFGVDGDRITVPEDTMFTDQPAKMLELFWQAQKNKLDIHPDALRLVTKNLRRLTKKVQVDPVANETFLNILAGPDPDKTLMRMNEAGVFGKFVPDFGRVVAQMQYDMYHVYTVDEHTIRAIGILYGIETGRLKEDHPLSCDVISEVQSRRVLYVAVLLHDIAKGRGGDHSELGADIAMKLCPRFGLNEWETETVSWLVRHHLLMSHTAFKRDIDDPKTVADFNAVVQSPERLRLLLVLTVADIRAVGPNVWNAWKAGLLRELYWRSYESISGEVPKDAISKRTQKAKTALEEALKGSSRKWTKKKIAEHLDLGRDSYWLAFDTDTLVRHAEIIRKAAGKGDKLYIELKADPDHDATEILVHTPDHPGLFAKVAGALSLGGISILDAKVITLNNGMALDVFWVQDGQSEAISGDGRTERIKGRIVRALQGTAPPARELREARKNEMKSRTKVFKVPPRVLIDNKASSTFTVIEVNGRDRLGFLHDITEAITKAGLQISSAHISTYGERVVDVFYVKDIFGLKMEQPNKIESVRKKLLTAIDKEAIERAPEAAE